MWFTSTRVKEYLDVCPQLVLGALDMSTDKSQVGGVIVSLAHIRNFTDVPSFSGPQSATMTTVVIVDHVLSALHKLISFSHELYDVGNISILFYRRGH